MATKKKPKKKAVAKVKAKPKAAAPVVKKGPRQKSLPGMEDRAIESLNDAALAYDEVKKERMGLTKQEVEAKKKVSDLMHAQKKKRYHFGNILIDLVPEGEKVKVKILPEGTEPSDEDLEKNAAEEAPEEPEPADEEPEEEEAEEAEEFDEEEEGVAEPI